MTTGAALKHLGETKYLYLREISEPDKQTFNNLTIVVEEAVVNYAGVVRTSRPELEAILKDAHPIESVPGGRRFRLTWKHYVAYLVTEELVGSNALTGYSDELFTGTVFRTYTKSHFLDHIARNTGGHLHDVRHFKIICLDHLIDVASYYPPEVELTNTPAETFGIQ